MKLRPSILIPFIILGGFVSSAEAALMTFNGSFSTALTPVANVPSSISGTFSFSFDTAAVPASGTYSPIITLDSISMTQLGNTSFNTTNAAINITYNNGSLVNAVLGGTLNGVTNVFGGTNDFFVVFRGATLDGATFVSADAATSNTTSLATYISPSSGMISAATVPEPASLAMLGIGLAGIGLVARKRRT